MKRVLAIDGRAANAAQRAGIGNFCAGLLRELPRVAAASGWKLRIYLDRPPRPGFPGANEASSFRVLPPCRFWTHLRLGPALRRERPDAFYAPGLQVPITTPCPAFATILDLAVMRYPQEFTWKRRALARLELGHAKLSCAGLVAISRSTWDDTVTLLGVPPGKVTVAMPGCDARFRPCEDTDEHGRTRTDTDPGGATPEQGRRDACATPEQGRRDACATGAIAGLRARMGLARPYVLFVGRIQPRKNLVRLMEAFDRVCTLHPDWPHELVIAGAPGWMDAPIHDAAKRLSCSERIRFAGFVPDEDLPALMSGAELFALVSLWEGFGMPLVEAMACGTAALTSNTSALAEVAGDAAEQVDPEDTDGIACALERLLADSALRAAWAEKGLKRAAQFTWAETARTVLRAVERATIVEETTE